MSLVEILQCGGLLLRRELIIQRGPAQVRPKDTVGQPMVG